MVLLKGMPISWNNIWNKFFITFELNIKGISFVQNQNIIYWKHNMNLLQVAINLCEGYRLNFLQKNSNLFSSLQVDFVASFWVGCDLLENTTPTVPGLLLQVQQWQSREQCIHWNKSFLYHTVWQLLVYLK